MQAGLHVVWRHALLVVGGTECVGWYNTNKEKQIQFGEGFAKYLEKKNTQ